MQRRTYITSSLCNLADRLEVVMSPSELLYHQLTSILIKLINLRALMEDQHLIDAVDILQSLLDIDNELEIWASCLPASWGYSVVPCISGENFYGTTYDNLFIRITETPRSGMSTAPSGCLSLTCFSTFWGTVSRLRSTTKIQYTDDIRAIL
jgi:hypothetical protein